MSDSLAIEGEDDSDGEVRRLEDGSLSREAIQHGDASHSGDDSRVSRVSFAEQDEVSFPVDDAYSTTTMGSTVCRRCRRSSRRRTKRRAMSAMLLRVDSTCWTPRT